MKIYTIKRRIEDFSLGLLNQDESFVVNSQNLTANFGTDSSFVGSSGSDRIYDFNWKDPNKDRQTMNVTEVVRCKVWNK